MTRDTALTAPVRAVTAGPRHHFFGYYDKCPWDAMGRYILALEVGFLDRPPGPDDVAVIGTVDLGAGNAWRPLAETRAWNWQQGAMLQWHPAAADQLIIHDDRTTEGFGCVIREAATGRVLRRLPRPVAAVSRDGRQALGLNFARVHRHRPGYGYVGLPDPGEHDPHPRDDGIWWMDLEAGESRLIVSLEALARFRPKPTFAGASHWFNHLQFNTDDSRFCFLHRWRVGKGWATRLFTAAPDGSDVRLLADDDLVSHFDWRDERHLLAWVRRPLAAGYADEDARDYRDGFYLIDAATGEATLVGAATLTRDGHSSYSPDRRWILTDEYAGRDHMRTLILYHVADGRRVDLGRFYSPPELAGEIRCDLHPRWNRDGTAVCFDSAHQGSRQMYVLDVRNITDLGK